MDKTSKIKISVENTSKRTTAVRTTRRPMMDFAPSKNTTPRQITPRMTEEERNRREIARAQTARREEIHRQIESQNEADIIARRRAAAARRELARQKAVEEEAARVRSEKEVARAEAVRLERAHERAQERLERAAAMERKRLVAIRRAEAARRELARRQAADQLKRSRTVSEVKNPTGSVDPIARKSAATSGYQPVLPTPRPATPNVDRQISVKADDGAHRVYGKVSEPSSRVMTRAEREYRALHPELTEKPRRQTSSINPSDLGDVNDFATEVGDDDAAMGEIEDTGRSEEDIEEILNTTEEEEDTSDNNYRYVLGGRSPFINTEKVIKRPLSGNNEGIAAEKLQRPGARLGKKALLGGPNVGDYVSPAEDPHAREAARRAAEVESRRRAHPELLDDNLATNPRYVPYEEPIPHKNLYARRKEAMKSEKKDVPTMVVADADKGSGMALAFVVFLTIVLGAIVGVIAYLAFFQ